MDSFENDKNYFDILPYDIMLKIFQTLQDDMMSEPKYSGRAMDARLVCKRFHAQAWDPALQTALKLHRSFMYLDVVQAINQRPGLRRLDIANFDKIESIVMHALTTCPDLKDLFIQFQKHTCYSSHPGERFFKFCKLYGKSLRYLELRDFDLNPSFSRRENTDCLAHISQLSFVNCSLRGKELLQLGKSFRKSDLKAIQLYTKCSWGNVEIEENELLQFLNLVKHSLQVLSFGPHLEITDKVLNVLSECEKLQSLYFFCNKKHLHSLVPLKKLKSLKLLKLNDTDSYITDTLIAKCFSNNKDGQIFNKLTELTLSHLNKLTDKGLEVILDTCPNLELMTLHDCKNINHNTMVSGHNNTKLVFN